jgi:DNA ligase-1
VTLLAEVARASARVAGNPGRLVKVREIAALLKRLQPDEVDIAIPFLSGELRQGKLSIGYGALQTARRHGQSQPLLALRDVDSTFAQLKETKGKGAASQRAVLVASLFGQATEEEQDFLVRLVVGELRQGALEGVMLEAVAQAAGVAAAEVRRAATFAGAIAPVARALLGEGPSALTRFSVRLMQPVLPMLAQPAADIEAALDQLGKALLEWKLDGARVQVHKQDDKVKVFTRSLNDVTTVVPEVVETVRRAPAASLILDGEAIALKPDGKPQPFQMTMRRFGRKAHDEDLRRDLPLSVFFFDCLFLNGTTLMDHPLIERRAALEKTFPPEHVVPALATSDAAEAVDFYADVLRHGHEGVMAKSLEAPYEAGRRGAAWLKVKSVHTLDLVVLAAEWGHGRRRGWLSNLHLGARDAGSGRFVMLGKTFKGLTDAMLDWQTRELEARAEARDEWTVHVRPELVVEVAFNDLQESPHYPAGLALRFARVKRYRPDKSAADADTIDTVRLLYEQQSAA